MRMPGNYILEGKKPVLCDDIIEWAMWYEKANRHVALTRFSDGINVDVSTVFLGIDYSWGGSPPILFETMIFGGEHDRYQKRYISWDDAEHGHREAVDLVLEEYSKYLVIAKKFVKSLSTIYNLVILTGVFISILFLLILFL